MMHDVVIIGGGHNGLVCSAYLAMAGLKVLVLDQRPVAGGAAVTEEFSPGFRNSVASYAVSLLNPKIIRELDLAVHGLRIVERPVSNFLRLGDGSFLKVGGSHTKREVAKFSARDAERLDDYQRRLAAVADVLRASVLETPPNVVEGQSICRDRRIDQGRSDNQPNASPRARPAAGFARSLRGLCRGFPR
jgi:phytoene dehydrogenase-like protein